MSAKLLKSLALGHCKVKNSSNIEVSVYWKDDRRQSEHRVIRPGSELDLLRYATITQLRRSSSLKNLFNRRLLTIVPQAT